MSEELRNRIARQLQPLHDELRMIEDERGHLADQIAALDEQAKLIRRVLKPVEEPAEKPEPEPKRNGAYPPSEEVVQRVLEGAREIGLFGKEFTARQLKDYLGADYGRTRLAIHELRERNELRLSSVRYQDGAKHRGHKSEHFTVVNHEQ